MLSQESLAKIDHEIAKYPADRKSSAVMAALRIAQDELGWLSTELMDFVANYLCMAPVAVYEVASFYNMYEMHPVGKYKITVCTNLSCTLMGAEGIAEHMKKKLGIDFGETTGDGRFTLKEGECMGACGEGPLFLVNNKRMCGSLSPEKVDQILAELE
ncbi:MAG: NADH-quinone oxidoreductase subunit NuoE [Sulfurimicrobium sp.]|jgi:NADH-quinone oxidoreductase subunit E|nr:NADH-quinone oxidoreductase subunit NuoE [Sulfurimicrobium sp.]MDO9189821.1 NADH-quinone oxidoreductase subunit NuoE [Sulfurimicrobium sp.]MDP1705535.1 NADH-quinone oxidoreductase subunit NuoE [Sulfurimicrobium sp.]MDP1896501.1 NADH-quinone oxidoreductase subunit NuoE [Sulfurimicrobium sp.]MDP2197733.1 NADH-quinone oxidoreductase subunit NuoE [Sulfurimicrobium sp.]